MGVWNELYFGHGVTDSAQGTGISRVWRVTGSTPQVAKGEPEAPHFGDEHPDDSDLVVNNASFLPEGAGTIVRAQYVPREYQDGTPPETNTTDADYYKIDSTYEDVDIDITVYELVTKSFPVAENAVETKSIWQPVPNKAAFRYSRVVHRITLNATVSGGAGVVTQLNIAQAVNTQTNKIHQIGGVKYLFKADGVRRVAVDKYQFTYRWVFDPGVKDTLVYDLSASPSMGIIGSYGYPREDLTGQFAGYTIGPYRRLVVAPDGSNPENTPRVVGLPAYEEDLTGWHTLPGVSP